MRSEPQHGLWRGGALIYLPLLPMDTAYFFFYKADAEEYLIAKLTALVLLFCFVFVAGLDGIFQNAVVHTYLGTYYNVTLSDFTHIDILQNKAT